MTRRPPGVIGAGFWQRLVGRHRRRTALCRPRVALVLRRSQAGAGPAERVVRLRELPGPASAWHVHLAWPGWLRPTAAPGLAPAEARAARSAGTTSVPTGMGSAMGGMSPRREWTAPSREWPVPSPERPVRLREMPVLSREWPVPSRAYPPSGESIARWYPTLSLRPARATVHRVLSATHAGGGSWLHMPTHPRYGDRTLPLVQTMIAGRSPATPAARRRPSLITVRAAEALLERARETAPARALQARDVIRRLWRQTEADATESPPLQPVHPAPRVAAEVARSSTLRLVQRRREAFAASAIPGPSLPSGGRVFQPVPRTLAQPVSITAAPAPSAAATSTSQAPAAHVFDGRSVPGQLDLARLSEEVYRQIERRARIERERRGR